MPIRQLGANLLIPNCLRSNHSYSPLAALELYVNESNSFMVAISPFVVSRLTVSLNKKERLLLKITALITKTQQKQADFKLKKNTDKLNLSGQIVRQLIIY